MGGASSTQPSFSRLLAPSIVKRNNGLSFPKAFFADHMGGRPGDWTLVEMASGRQWTVYVTVPAEGTSGQPRSHTGNPYLRPSSWHDCVRDLGLQAGDTVEVSVVDAQALSIRRTAEAPPATQVAAAEAQQQPTQGVERQLEQAEQAQPQQEKKKRKRKEKSAAEAATAQPAADAAQPEPEGQQPRAGQQQPEQQAEEQQAERARPDEANKTSKGKAAAQQAVPDGQPAAAAVAAQPESGQAAQQAGLEQQPQPQPQKKGKKAPPAQTTLDGKPAAKRRKTAGDAGAAAAQQAAAESCGASGSVGAAGSGSEGAAAVGAQPGPLELTQTQPSPAAAPPAVEGVPLIQWGYLRGRLEGKTVVVYYKGRWWQGEVSFPFGYTNGVRVACGPGGKEQVLHVSTGDLRLYTLRDGSLVGVAIRKEFDGKTFEGAAVGYESPYYRLRYSDGDEEEAEVDELLALMHESSFDPQPGSALPRFNIPIHVGPDLPDHPDQKAAAPRRPRAPRARAAAPADTEAEGPAERQEGLWAPCGAGHARGVQVWDGVAKKMRPIGAWIADKDVGTVMGRRLGMDRRHLGDRAADAPPKAYVPGWVGVRTESGKPWTPAYAGAYIPSLYETTMATVLPMKCLEVDTPEEAARHYDRLAVNYSGAATADTNYPVDEELLRAMGPRVDSRSVSEHKNLLYSAIQLMALEQSVPHAALKPSGAAPDWDAWERRVLGDYLLSHPGPKAAPELAGEIAWLLGLVAPAAVLPTWRGQPLKDFLAACKRCTETGSRFTHFHPDPATCPTCILNSKGEAKAPEKKYTHGETTLVALAKVAGTILSQDALAAFEAGGSTAEAEAAAQKGQRVEDEVLAKKQAALKAASRE